MSRESQRAGDYSRQVLVQGDYYEGITVEEATAIAEQAARKVFAQEFVRGEDVALQRIEQLSARVIRQLDGLQMLESFADPSFQVSFRMAQIGAASTERERDYELLANLLEDRALRGGERTVRAGLNQAIRIVDQLDDGALTGLTALQAGILYSPTAGLVEQGLDVLDSLFAQLLVDPLPRGGDWLDHLDILGAIRINAFGINPFEQVLGARLPGYVATGLEERSEILAAKSDELVKLGLNIAHVPHELKPGFVRLPWVSLNQLTDRMREIGVPPSKSEEVAHLARSFGLEQADPALYDALAGRLDSRPNLSTLRQWWNALPSGVQVTATGRLLARANAERLDALRMLPPMD